MHSPISDLLLAAEYLERQEAAAKAQQAVIPSSSPTTYGSARPSSPDSYEPDSPFFGNGQDGSEAQSPPTLRSESPNSFDKRTKNKEIHNQLEKSRRAYMKKCFNDLQKSVPTIRSSKLSTLAVLQHASDYITQLKQNYKGQLAELEALRQQRDQALHVLQRFQPAPTAHPHTPTTHTPTPPPSVSERSFLPMDCRRDSLSKIDHTHFPNPPPPPPPPNSYNFSSFAENPVFSHYGASSLPTNGFTTRPSALSRSDSRSSRSDHGEVFMMDEGVGPNRNDLGRDSSPSEPGQDSMYEEDEVIEEEMGGQYYAASGESASSVEMESRPMAIPHYGGHNGQYDWRR